VICPISPSQGDNNARQTHKSTYTRPAINTLERLHAELGGAEAMTASEIAAAVLRAEGVEDAPAKQVQILGQSIKASLRNHAGKGVEQVNGGIPAKWSLRFEKSSVM
jgi:hypothetical protein